jgi:hypothetical protein
MARPFTFIPQSRRLGRLCGWLEEYRTVTHEPTQVSATEFSLTVSGPVTHHWAPWWRRIVYHALWITDRRSHG